MDQDKLSADYIVKQRDILQRCQKQLDARFPDLKQRQTLERAWAAGFFDGEGHVALGGRLGDFRCEVEQVERINLERFQQAVGNIGSIEPRTGIFRWRITNQADLQNVFDAIGDFLGPDKLAGFHLALAGPARSAVVTGRPLPSGTISVEATRSKQTPE